MLVSPAFQSRHALPERGNARAAGDTRSTGMTQQLDEEASDPLGPEVLAREQRAWLIWLRQPWYGRSAATLEATVLNEDAGDARAAVLVRIVTPMAAPFELRFLLSRERSGDRWRIDAIEADNVPPASHQAACIVAPSRQLGCFP